MVQEDSDRSAADSDLDERIRALSHSARRQILRICASEFVLAGDIANTIDLAPASVSEHLKVLRKTGLMELRRTGTMWLYRTDTVRLRAVLQAMTKDVAVTTESESK